MTRKKTRMRQIKEKRKERNENDWRKKKYNDMAKNGFLGCKEIQNYSIMYNSLNGQKEDFPSPENNPTKKDYNNLKILYHSLESKFGRRY